MTNRAGFNYKNSIKNLFKLANSSDDFNKTTLEGFRYICNENFQVAENEVLKLDDLLNRTSALRKIKYRNSSYLIHNYLANSDFAEWNSGLVFNFDSANIQTSVSDNWSINTNGSTGSCFRSSFIPHNQVEVPEFPDYYLGLYVNNYVGKSSLSQRLANASLFSGKTLTLSGYIRSTENAISIKPKIRIKYGTTNVNLDTFIEGSLITLQTSFSRYSSVFNIPSTVLSKITPGSYIEVILEVQELGIYEVHFSSFQLEEGLIATPYKENINIENQSLYLVDTTLLPISLNLPNNPSSGDIFAVFDVSGTFNLNNLTLKSSGQKIVGKTTDLVLSDDDFYHQFLYLNDNIGWICSVALNPTSVDSGQSRIEQTQSMITSLVLGGV